MINIKKYKLILKTSIREEQLKNEKFLLIGYTVNQNLTDNKLLKINKKQFAKNKVANHIMYKEAKFPIEIVKFDSEYNLKQNIRLKKNNHIVLISNHLFKKNRSIELYCNSTRDVYEKLLDTLSPFSLCNIINDIKKNESQQ